ncbi:MAG: tRNA (adenosine(37)-N6)-threonylcarbamoyltransferase complex dimerization subunit type 1 TsaB [Deltaproteobacteria bacterium]|nr:tRNA (adenosine(37)-N6)-threonylcarbamoyltransferase complex dimerization subunit type 1 TsaB [Deltaproteobacteria bacterium]
MAHTQKDIKGLRKPVILALETATMCGSVALVAGSGLVAEFSLQSMETHSRRLLAGVDRLLLEAAVEWTDIDAVAVSQGPGSFTGLRIGLATAKGLAMTAGAKLIGVGTLDGLAAQLFAVHGCLVCPVLDARKKEVYCGFYRCDTNGIPRLVGEYQVVTPEVLCEKIDEPVIMLGDGLLVYGDFFQEKLADFLKVPPLSTYFPRAASIGMLAREKWQEAEFLDPAATEPIYIRPSEAELNIVKN